MDRRELSASHQVNGRKTSKAFQGSLRLLPSQAQRARSLQVEWLEWFGEHTAAPSIHSKYAVPHILVTHSFAVPVVTSVGPSAALANAWREDAGGDMWRGST